MLGTAPTFQNGTIQCPQEKRGRTPLAKSHQAVCSRPGSLQGQQTTNLLWAKTEDRQGGRWPGKVRDHPQEEHMYHEEEQTAPDLQIRPSWWKGTLPGTHNPMNMWPWRNSHTCCNPSQVGKEGQRHDHGRMPPRGTEDARKDKGS